MLDRSIDYAPFASSKFNPTLYANAILAGERYDPEEIATEEPETSRNKDESTLVDDARDQRKGRGGMGNGPAGTASLSVKGDVSVALAKLNYGIVSTPGRMRVVSWPASRW